MTHISASHRDPMTPGCADKFHLEIMTKITKLQQTHSLSTHFQKLSPIFNDLSLLLLILTLFDPLFNHFELAATVSKHYHSFVDTTQYFSLPLTFLQECPESSGIHRNGAGILRNDRKAGLESSLFFKLSLKM